MSMSPVAGRKFEARRRLSTWRRWALALLILGVLQRLGRYLLRFPVWGDEAFICLNLMDRDFRELAGRLRFDQVAPILFLWGEAVVYRLLGGSELALRLLPVLAGVASLLLFARLAHLTLRPTAALMAIGILAVSYYPVRHSCEIKPYAFDLLASLLLLTPAACRLRWAKRRGPLVLLALVVPLALAASYPAAFIAGGVSLTLLPGVCRQRDRVAWLLFLTFNVLMLAAFVALYFGVGRGQMASMVGASGGYWDASFPPAEPWPLLRWLVAVHTGNLFAYPVGGRAGGSLLTLLFCLVGAAHLARRRRAFFLLLCSPFVLTFVAAALGKYPYGGSARVAQHLAPSICLLAGAGVVQCVGAQRRRKCWILGVVVTLFLIGCVGVVRDLRKPYKTESDERARAFVRRVLTQAGPDDRILVLAAPLRLYPSFEWYLRLGGSAVVWTDALEQVPLGPTVRQVWCLRFSSNDSPNTSPLSRDAGFVLAECEEYTLNMGSEPDATRSCSVSRWVRR